ncbi:MAG: VCBS repeat-containing protein [Cyclobacteriaceae bacterium]
MEKFVLPMTIQKPLYFTLLITLFVSSANSQQLKKANPNESAEQLRKIESLRTEYQKPLAGSNAVQVTGLESIGPVSVLEQDEQTVTSKSLEFSKVAYEQYLENLSKRFETNLSATKQVVSSTALEVKQEKPAATAKELGYKEDLQDDVSHALHQQIHQQNIQKQQSMLKMVDNLTANTAAKVPTEIDKLEKEVKKDYSNPQSIQKTKEDILKERKEAYTQKMLQERTARVEEARSKYGWADALQQAKSSSAPMSLAPSISKQTTAISEPQISKATLSKQITPQVTATSSANKIFRNISLDSSDEKRVSSSDNYTVSNRTSNYRMSSAPLLEVPSGTTYDTMDIGGVATILITDGGNGIGTNTFTTDYVYALAGLCFVNEGQTLTIQPGAVIKGYTFQTEPSMLIVAVGGTLIANGTETNPIVFTGESDQLAPPASASNLSVNFDENTNGQWGGVAILGDYSINNELSVFEPLGGNGNLPFESRLEYGGGEVNFGNSGTSLTYVSIRHTGEINGVSGYGGMPALTIAGVGNEAVLNHIEVVGAAANAYNFYGGNADASNLIAYNVANNGFETDLGYTGKLQFLFAKGVDGTFGEHHGGYPEDIVVAGAYIYNATYVGDDEFGVQRAASFDRNGQGHYYNSIFSDLGTGVVIEYSDTSSTSYDAFTSGSLFISENIFHNVSGGDYLAVSDISDLGFTGDPYLETGASGNVLDDPILDAGFVPSNTYTFGFLNTGDSFYEVTDYAGAFAPASTPWYADWSFTSQLAGGSSSATEPLTAPDNVIEDPNNVISVFNDIYDNPPAVDLNPNWGQATIQSLVDIGGNSVSKLESLNYQGIDFGQSLDLTGMETMHLDMWTANATSVDVYLISGNTVETSVSLTIVPDQWEAYDIPLADFTGVDLSDVIQIKFDDAGAGDAPTIFLDNIMFYTLNPVVAPMSVLPFDFEGNPSKNDFLDFEGGHLTIQANPAPMGINLSDSVGQMIKGPGTEFGGSFVNLQSPLDFVSNNVFTMKVYTPAIGTSVLLKVENIADPNINFSQEVSTNIANDWEELTFDFSGIDTGNGYDRVVFIFDLGIEGDSSSAFTYYFDDLALSGFNQPYVPVSTLPFDFETNPSFDDIDYFEGAFISVVSNPDPSGINTSIEVAEIIKEPASETWGGSLINLASPMDLTTNNIFKAKVRVPFANTPIILRLEDRFGNSPYYEVQQSTTLANQWEELTFDFSGIDTNYDYDRVIFQFNPDTLGDGGPNSTYYLDDVVLAGFIAPPGAVSTLPFDFEMSPDSLDFEDFSGAMLSIIDNPQVNGINTSGKVGQVIKGVGDIWAGSIINLADSIDFSTNKVFKLKVFAPAVGTGVLLKVENSNDPDIFYERELFTTVANEWEELSFNFIGVDETQGYHKVILIFENGISGDGSAAFTYLIDDLELIEGNGADINLNDYDALIALRSALGGDLVDNWLDVNPPSSWPNIDFDGSGRVNALYLDNHNLSGDVPVELTTLSELGFLTIGGNAITSFPEGMGNLDKVGQIYAWGNQLTTLPSDILDMSSLFNLDLSGNQLTEFAFSSVSLGESEFSLQLINLAGNQLNEIPSVVYGLSYLTELNVDSNSIGSISSGISNLSMLQTLNIGFNNFTTLPAEISLLTGLYNLYAYGNSISSLPDLSSNRSLREIRLWNNQITNNIADFFVLDSLEVLDIYNNQISGTLDGIGNMKSIREFYAGVNQISGGIPAEISSLTDLVEFRLHDNLLNGNIAGELFELPMISNIELYSNQLTGTFPTTNGSSSLNSLNLSNNAFTSFSPSIGNFPSLTYLSLEGNQLSGLLPIEISSDTSLLEIHLQYNQLTGGIPAEWGDLINLEGIFLTGNLLDQPLPEELGNWSNLKRLAIDQNKIPGEIPASFSNLMYLEGIYIYDNQLTGLPDWSALEFLGEIYLFNNYLGFNDLEPLMQTPAHTFGFEPMYPGSDSFEILEVGQNLTIDAQVGGTSNRYAWFLDDQYLEVADTSHLVIENFSRSDAGTYRCLVTNDSINSRTYLEIGSGNRTYWIQIDVAAADSMALVDIYHATQGYQWNDSENWLSAPVAMWEGVIIEGGRVTELDLGLKNLIGSVPPTIGQLDALKRLSFWNNPEIGNFAGELYGLSNLTFLDLANVGLKKISPSINLLTNLDTLWIGDNPIRGSVPNELFDLTGLKLLDLRNNSFSGSFPNDLNRLTNLEHFNLFGSTDISSIPDVFDQLPNLKKLYISYMDNMTGPIPSTITSLSNLEELNLSGTPFTSGLELVGSLTTLRSLWLYGSPLAYTSLPSEFSALTNLETLGLGFADYSAGIPDVIWNFTRMKYFQMPECNVNGPLPAQLSSWDSLIFLNLRNNGFSGGFPSDFNTEFLEHVFFHNNSIDDISALEGATNVQRFFAYGNKLEFSDFLPFQSAIESGAFFIIQNQQPTNGEYNYLQYNVGDSIGLSMNIGVDTLTVVDWFKDGNYIGSGKEISLGFAANPDTDGQYEANAYHSVLSDLGGLHLNTGILDVQVVDSIDPLDSAALISFYDNIDNASEVLLSWKNGPVETWEGVIAHGGRVYGLALNGLQGTIPGAAIANLTTLEFLQMSDGELTGEIPTEIFIESLTHLDLGRNQLTGSIPVELNNSPFLNFIGLAGNQLTGSIPELTLPDLNQFYLDNNALSGAVPSWFNQNNWGGLSLDRNKFDALPQGLDTALVNAFYVNFEYNSFDLFDLIRASGNSVGADVSHGVQSETRAISFTGDANIGGTVTLTAQKLHPDDQFTWFSYNKYNQEGNAGYDYITFTGSDSTLVIEIDGEHAQTNYIASVGNFSYKNGGYEFLTKSISVDPYDKRYATAMEASPLDESSKGSNQAVIGMPDLAPNGWEWEQSANWWENPLSPDTDTLKLMYEDSPIPINYVRLYGATPLALFQMTLRGASGEEQVINVGSYINHWDKQIVFPKTSFAVTQVDFAVREGAIDAIEIGDTGEGIEAPVLDDRYTSIGEDHLYIEIKHSNPLSDYIVLERSTDGSNFVLADTLYREGWHYRQVPPGKYYYRAKAGYSSFDLVSGYSNVLGTGNCEPTFPSGKLWAGSSLASGNYEGTTGERSEVSITPIGYAEFSVSDVTAGWYDQFFGFYEDQVNLLQKCDVFYGFTSGGQVGDVNFTYENDTLYAEWYDYNNGVEAVSKFWVTGDAPVITDFDPGIPTNLTSKLVSSKNIEVTWDVSHPDAQYIVQRSVANSTQYVSIDTVSINSFLDTNTLDNKLYFYRVVGLGGEIRNNPSNESCIVHKPAIFEPLNNIVTTDITRTSYGGSWGDFDGDGDDDLYVVNAFDQSANFLYENTGNGTFRKVIGSIATSEEAFTRSASWGDYDNDGFMDLLVPTRDIGDQVYRNTGSKSFERKGSVITAATDSIPSESAIWVDLDQDGNLDVINSNGLVFTNDGAGNFALTSRLENDNGILAEQPILIWTVSNVDIDNDGDQDIYFTGDAANMLFLNDGLGGLTYVENEISNTSLLSRGFSWADFNNDGYIDLITGDRSTELFGIYLNMGDGSFAFLDAETFVVASNTPVTEMFVGRGYSTADLNNDGTIDIVGMLDSRARIFYNNGQAEFTMVEEDAQTFPLTSNFSHISLADINSDGFVDLFLPNQAFEGNNFMYLNNGNGNNWLSVRLKGIESNRSGIGARINVKSNNVWQTQTVRTMNGISSGNSLTAEFGIGSAGIVDSVEVAWPSGKFTYALNVSPNQLLSMVEIPEASGPTVNVNDSTALRALYAKNGGENWVRKQGWLVGSPLGWEGVDFDDNGRVVSLILNDNNLTDTIAAAITSLTELKVLDLSGNNLIGPMPSDIGNLTALENLSLNENQLDGTIPASIGSLVNLQNLDLYSNNFFGELPRTLGGLVNLRQFEIQNNGFIGFVPAEIGTLSNLAILRMDHNDFEGALPSGLGGMTSLQVLYVNDNHFTEGLPAGLGSLSTLLELKAQNNEFFGPLPSELSNLKELQYVDISNNMFTGSIAPLVAGPYVYYFNADNNRFNAMPDINTFLADSILLRNNAIDFGFFELNDRLIKDGRLKLNPQAPLFDPVDTLQNVGSAIEIAYEIGGSFNTYNWSFNGSPLTSSTGVDVTDAIVFINSPDTPNQGVYLLEITNSNYPGVTLTTSPFTLKLSSLERDKQALLDFMEAVNKGDFPVTLNWSESSTLTSDWDGVTVEGDRVTALELPAVVDTDLSDGNQSQIFDGLVPLSFTDLSGLKTLDLKNHFLRSFPNISNWPSIETVDISNNRLAFKDIIPNVKLGTKITYIPQRRYDVTLNEIAPAGDDKIVRINMSGTGLQYQWKFGKYLPGQAFNNDVVDIPNANSRVYQIENLDFDKMGTYRVDITHPDVPGLTITSRNRNILASTDVFGTAFADGSNTLLTDGEVILFRKTPEGPYVAEDTVLLDGGGEYAFQNVVLGDFIVLTKPDRTVFENTIATYYEQADLFENATVLEVRNRVEGIDIQMVFYEEPEPEPTGADFDGLVESEFEDDFEQDEEGSGRVSARRKVKKAGCSMRRFVRSGRPEEDVYELYAYVESDDEGRFNFVDIEEGKYRLNIQYPGVPMDPDSEIEFIVGGDKENQQFSLVATITEDGIVVDAEEVLYTMKPYIKDINLFPNPTDEVMVAEFLVYRKLNDLKMEIHDVRGVKLFEIPLAHRMGPQVTKVDLSEYKSGVYFMVFTDEAGTFRQQLKIGKK